MEINKAIQEIIGIIRRLHDGLINLHEAKLQAHKIFRQIDTELTENMFTLAFPILVEYFFNPVKKARAILQENNMSMDKLLSCHRFIRESALARLMFESNRYPRSLLIKSATNLLNFMQKNIQYMPKILRGEAVGPMMLEIHPTDAMCTYRCQMCIWCGGQKNNSSIAGFYGSEKLISANRWCEILDEARDLGTRQIIFSGGGETLLSQAKIKKVLDRANSIGFETMIYTNGRTLCDDDSTLLDSILDSTWLRISLHAATPEIYSRLVNRPLGANDLEFVLDGIRRITILKKKRKAKLKIGIGVVLQEKNYSEVLEISRLCSDLEIDFLDLRVDCIGVTEKLSKYQHEQMLADLGELRANVENSQLSFNASFADDLLMQMDKWEEMELTKPRNCLISAVRPAIDPFGIVGSCDSIGEPYTRSKSPREYVLGQISNNFSFLDIMRGSAGKKFGIRCKYCMPGQLSLNALLEKLIDDFKNGINPSDQPLCFSTN